MLRRSVAADRLEALRAKAAHLVDVSLEAVVSQANRCRLCVGTHGEIAAKELGSRRPGSPG
jgi:hypothetical protein